MEEETRANAIAQTKRLRGKLYREAAEKLKDEAIRSSEPESTKTPSSPETAASSPRNIVEVVIKVGPGHPSYDKIKGKRDDAPKNRPRRSAGKAKAIVISDDEETKSDSDFEGESREVSPLPEPKQKKAAAAKAVKRKRIVESDDEFSAEETGSDDPPPPTSEEESASVISSKPAASIKKKGKAVSSRSVATSSDESPMDVDEVPTKGKKGKAAKSKKESKDRPAKRQKRTDSDPWKLGSRAVKRDWTQMQAPPMEIFHFARKVVDEYTYLDGKVHSLVTNITAERQWVLSGTPPIHDFAALKTIAAFLNLHLGVDDDGEGQSVEVKKRRREQTGTRIPHSPWINQTDLFSLAVEKFHSFREVHTLEWHAHRHELGQTFLNQFVRQVCGLVYLYSCLLIRV